MGEASGIVDPLGNSQWAVIRFHNQSILNCEAICTDYKKSLEIEAFYSVFFCDLYRWKLVMAHVVASCPSGDDVICHRFKILAQGEW